MPDVIVGFIAIIMLLVSLLHTDSMHYPTYLKFVVLEIGVLTLWIVWAWQAAWRKTEPGPATPRAWLRTRLPEVLLVAYGLWAALSVSWSGMYYVSMLGVIPVVFRLSWCLLAAHFVRTRAQVLGIIYVVALAGVLVAAVMAYLVTYTEKTLPTGEVIKVPVGADVLWARAWGRALPPDVVATVDDRLSVLMGHRNFMAMFLLPPILILMQFCAQQFWRARAPDADLFDILPVAFAELAAVGLMLWVLLLTQSRGAFIGLAFGVGMLVLVRVPKRWRLLFVAGVLLLGIVLGGILYSKRDQLLQKRISGESAKAAIAKAVSLRDKLFQCFVASRQQPDISTRYFYYIGSWRMFMARPWLGWGAGTFLSRFHQFRPIESGKYAVMGQDGLHPHNHVLYIVLQYGIIGLALFVAALVAAFRGAARFPPPAPSLEKDAPGKGLPAAPTPDDIWWPVAAAMIGAGAMLVHSLFDVCLRFWGPADLFWLLIGLLLAVGRGAARRNSPIHEPAIANPQPAGIVVFVVTLCLAGLVGLEVLWPGASSERIMCRADSNDIDAYRLHDAKDAAGELSILNSVITDYEHSIYDSRYNIDYVQTRISLVAALGRGAQAAEMERQELLREAVRSPKDRRPHPSGETAQSLLGLREELSDATIQNLLDRRLVSPGMWKSDLSLGDCYFSIWMGGGNPRRAAACRHLMLAYLQSSLSRRPYEFDSQHRLALVRYLIERAAQSQSFPGVETR